MGKRRTWRAVSCVMVALVCLMPVLCLERQSNLFLFGSLGMLLGSLAALAVLALSYGDKAQRAIPLLELAGIVLLCASLWFLLQTSDRTPDWVPSHWALYVPFLGRVALCAIGAVSAFCFALLSWNGKFALRPLNGIKGSLSLGLLILCFVWGALFEGFWFAVWLIPVGQEPFSGLLSAGFAFCLYGLLALFCCKASDVLLKENKGSAPILISFAMMFFAAGQLSWGLLNRLLGSSSWSFETSLICLILVLLTGIFSFVSFRRYIEKPLGEVEPCKEDELDYGWLVEAFGLSEREAQAASFVIEGMNSEEAAEKMGVKAPTVRTYLQRAYKKVGVQGLDELARKIKEVRPTLSEASAGKEEGDGGSPSPRRVRLSSTVRSRVSVCSIFSFGLIVGLALVPHSAFLGDAAWRVSQVHSQLAGLLLALLGGFVFILAYVGIRPRCFNVFSSSLAELRQRMNIGLCLLFVLLLFASLASLPLWIALMAIAAVVFASCSALLLLAPVGDEQGDGLDEHEPLVGSFEGARTVALFVLFSMCGYVFEDAWRPATDDFTWWIQTAFLVVLIFYLAMKVKKACFVWPSLLFAAFFVADLGCGIRVVLLVLVVSFWFCLVVEGKLHLSSGALPLCIAAFGLAMLAARWLTDAWWDQMSYDYVSAVSHGGFWLGGAVVPAVELLFVVASLGSLVCLAVLDKASQMTFDLALDETGMPLYFASRGLTSLESDVLIGLAKGKTGVKLAQELHYAVGTINAARWSAFKKLGIHSRDGLLRLLGANGFASVDGAANLRRNS